MIGFDNPPSEGSSYVQNSSDKFTSLGTVTRFLNSFKFEPSFKWIIDLNPYAEPVQFNVNVATADPGLYRKDICYATTDNQLHYLSGEASTTVAIAPILPLNSLLLGSWTIFGDVISDFVPRVNGLQLTVEAGDSFEKTIGDFEYIFNVFKYYFSYYMYLITIRNTADGSYSSLRVSEAGAYIESGNGFGGMSGVLSLEPALEPNLFSRTAYGDNSFKIPFRTVVGDATFRPPNNLPAGNYELAQIVDYSSVEKELPEKWIDGKTIYRITFEGNTNTGDIDISTLNIKTLVNKVVVFSDVDAQYTDADLRNNTYFNNGGGDLLITYNLFNPIVFLADGLIFTSFSEVVRNITLNSEVTTLKSLYYHITIEYTKNI